MFVWFLYRGLECSGCLSDENCDLKDQVGQCHDYCKMSLVSTQVIQAIINVLVTVCNNLVTESGLGFYVLPAISNSLTLSGCFSTVFESYQDDEWVTLMGCV